MTGCHQNDFMRLVQFEQFGDGISAPVDTLRSLAESGRAGRFVHMATEGFRQWDVTCALEDALIDSRQCDGWLFVVGSIADDPEVKGWLEYGDWIVVPYGPERSKRGSDVGVWHRRDFDELDYSITAMAEAGPDSGIKLNAIMRALGHDILGQ